MNAGYHVPALAEEVERLLEPRPGQTFVDGTVGGGGHALRLGGRLQPGGTLAVIDQDPEALEAASSQLASLNLLIIPIRGNFRNMPALLKERGIAEVEGILLDLGVSSHQLDAAERGFSFRADSPLDMRMDATAETGGETAADLLRRLDEREIARILREYGEERWAARIARFIAERRGDTRHRPVATTKQLADLVSAAIPKAAQPRGIHPATRTFQALRIAVNDELGALRQALEGGVDILARGGRFAVISWHSLEDRLVKQTFASMTGRCTCPPGLPVCRCGAQQVLRLVTHKPVLPSDQEVKRNPRARSAKLRVAEKVIGPRAETTRD